MSKPHDAELGPPLEGDLVEQLIQRAERSPDELLYIELLDGVHESGRITAAELRDRAATLGTALREQGLQQGDVVLLLATPPIEFLVGLLGCMWAGVIAAPIAFPRRPEHVETRLGPVRANAGAVAVVTGSPQGPEQSVLDLLTQGEIPVVPISSVASGPERPREPDCEIAYIQYTSGSTSDPRGVVITHDNLRANLEVDRQLLRIDETGVNVSWCPLTHDMGLIMGALPAIAFGMRCVLMPPLAFVKRPVAWMRAMAQYGGTHGYSPNFGYDLVVERSTDEDRAHLDLTSVRCLINGAEPIRRRTRDRFFEAFAATGVDPRSHMHAYGLAESTVIVSASPWESPGQILWVDAAALERDEVVIVDEGAVGARELCGDGVPGSGYDVRVVDPETCVESPEGRVGEIWVRGPSVSPGYWRRARETAETFGGALVGDDGGPYLRTGDLGFIHEGEIVMTGRAKDLIIVRGRNIYPHDIEQAAELAHDAVRSGGSAAFAIDDEAGEALVVVVEVNGEPDEGDVVSAIGDAVLNEFELRVADVLLVGPQTVPKTSSGKKQRSATRELWQRAREGAATS